MLQPADQECNCGAHCEDEESKRSFAKRERRDQRRHIQQLRIQQASALSTSSSTKSVSFSESVVTHVNQIWCLEECPDMWYTAQEYSGFRQQRLDDTTRILQQDCPINQHNRMLNDSNYFSYQNVLERTYKRFCQPSVLTKCFEDDDKNCTNSENNNPSLVINGILSRIDEQQFRLWIKRTAEHRLGLEGNLCKAICCDRQCRQREMIDLILEIQKDFEFSERRTQAIGRACRYLSRPSVLWAQLLAHAGTVEGEPNENGKYLSERG